MRAIVGEHSNRKSVKLLLMLYGWIRLLLALFGRCEGCHLRDMPKWTGAQNVVKLEIVNKLNEQQIIFWVYRTK